MKEQLMLLSVLMLALDALHNHFTGRGNAFSFAGAGRLPKNNWAANLYQAVSLYFEKEAEDLKKEFTEGFEKYKGQVKDLVDGIKDATGQKSLQRGFGRAEGGTNQKSGRSAEAL